MWVMGGMSAVEDTRSQAVYEEIQLQATPCSVKTILAGQALASSLKADADSPGKDDHREMLSYSRTTFVSLVIRGWVNCRKAASKSSVIFTATAYNSKFAVCLPGPEL